MPRRSGARSSYRRRWWTLAVAYAALLASCDSPFAPVIEEVIRLEVSPSVLQLVVGGNATLTARVFGAGDAQLLGARVFWSTQDPAVVTVNQAGLVTAVGPGTAQIAASAGGQSRTIAVTVAQPPIALVRINPPAGNVIVGGSFTFTGEALDGTGAVLPNRPLEWASSAPTVATVNSAGVVTGVAVGQATISATGEGKTGTAVVSVMPAPVATITIQPNGGNLTAGTTLMLTATARDAAGQPLTGRRLEWSSSNDGVATVSSSGLLTAISPGTVSITVTAPGEGANGTSPSASVTITVLIVPVASAVIVPGTTAIQIGATAALTLNLFDAAGEPLSTVGRTVTWSSGNTAVATVNSSGVVTGVATGSATIQATITTAGLTGSVQATAQVTVSNVPVAAVTVTPSPAIVHVGYARQFTAVARDAQGNPLPGRAILWTSGNQGIAVVDANSGGVTGISQGTVAIRATSEGVQGTANVTIDLVAVSSVTVTPISATVMPGQTVQLTAAPRDSANTIIQGTALGNRPTTWSSNNPAIATVNATGLVTGVAVGNTTITAGIGGTASGTSAITVNPLPSASQLAVTTQPSATVQNDIAFPVQPVVQLKDVNGNNVAAAGVSIQAAITAPGTGALGGTATAVTNASGAATFTDLKITGTIGARTLTFTSGTLTSATSSGINVQAGVPTQLILSTPPPSTANSGQVFSSAAVVQLRDVSGNNVPQGGVTVTAAHSPSAGVTLGGASAVTNGSGAATFGALVLTGPAGNYTLTFSSGALTPVTSGTIALGAGSGSRVAIVQQPSGTAQNGVVFATQPVVQLVDGSGNPVAQGGVVVLASILTGAPTLNGPTTATTNGSGTATFGGLSITGTVGTRTLLFGASGFTAVESGPIAITPGNPTSLAITTQPPASVANGSPLSPSPAVRITDVSGNGVSGLTVNAAIASGGGALSGGTSATTDATGAATFAGLTITGLVGPRTLTFSSGALNATSGTVTVTAGAAASMSVTTPPTASVANDVVFPQQPVVRVLDGSGNGVPNQTVTAAITAGGGTLGGTAQATSDASGFATFSGLKITGSPGARTLGFSSGSLTPVSAPVTITVGAATNLTVTTAPQSPVANDAVFSPQPAVTITDVSGTPVPGVTVTAAITAGGGTLGGTPTAVTSAQGVASFAGLKITGTIGTRTLTFSAGSLSATANVNVTFGSATQLALTTAPPANVVNGAQFSAVVQLRDVSGNAVATAGTNIGVALTGGAPAFSGTTPVATGGAGSASFTDLSITGLVGARQLTFSSGSLTPVAATVTVTGGAAATLAVTTQPSGSVANDVVFPQQPVVQVTDASTNPVPNVIVTASIASGGGTLGGTAQATSDAGGFATFSGLKITGTPGARTLGFSAGALNATSGAINVTVGAAAALNVTTAPQSPVANDAVMSPQPAVTVTDVSGTPVPGVTVTAAVTAGAGTLGGTSSAVSDAMGVATFAGLKITGPAGPHTLTFSAGSLTAQSGVNVTFGSATQLVLTTPPPANVANGSVFSAVVQLQDVSGNAVATAAVPVSVAMTTGAGVFGGTTPVATSGAGSAAFTDLSITGLVGARQLTFSSGGLTSAVASVTVTPGAAASLTVTTPPSGSVPNDAVFPQQPVVQILDASTNPVPNVTVTASISAGGGTLGGTVQATSDANGFATFSGLKITGTIGNRTLTFTAGSLSATASVDITFGAPNSVVFTTAPPGAATSGVPLAPAPVLQVRDISGNDVMTAGINVSASLTSGTGALSGTTVVATDGAGSATFSNLIITGASGANTLTFTATGAPGTAQATVTLSFFFEQSAASSSSLPGTTAVETSTRRVAYLNLPNDIRTLARF